MTSPKAEFRVLGREAIMAALPMTSAIDLMENVMMDVSRGNAHLPLRTVMHIPESRTAFATMPGYVSGSNKVLGTKLLCLFPDNPANGLSSHTGVMLLFDPDTGKIIALLDAAEITALRTPAATAAASRTLARAESGDLAMLGTGEQAFAHLRALAIVHPLRRVRVWGRSAARAAQFVAEAKSTLNLLVEPCTSVRDTVRNADLICTATASRDPILEGAWISPGAHVSLVGACDIGACEIDIPGVVRSRFFVDLRASAVAQAGELHAAIAAGAISLNHIAGEIGEVYLGRIKGRSDNKEITIYKSLGIAAQDLAASHAVLSHAVERGLGVLAAL
jgi:ornithine cyclodeaminase/alanine dehydrogenase-like protein (mu-crystallin family)